MKPITIGAVGTASAEVTVDNLACTVESGALPVFATPMMAALMEEAACAAVEPYLAEYCGVFGLAQEDILRENFFLLEPNTQNPYRQLYCYS